MTTQRWDDERLDRLADRIENTAKIAENNTRNIEALGQRIESTAEALGQRIENTAKLAESNARVIQALAETAAEAREERMQILQIIAQQQTSIDRQQTNIDGLRTETIRMLDILLNQRNQQDNSGEQNS
ncbi:hypothetical protein PN499_27595 [Kamptonema animale CS-326]|jgi:predicted Rossmann fold nucleotide-binding protein DprA/Smf involved in DNA uptake|uniref:hypothetical protein n=1 Tax=Kamptonema animale TaxID=92934 RepID=UPI00232DA7DC|nr:hypothetical protein [Kamptonema animale]MDB9514970.1 hypothetical protein [Kamptonema animale CS-326]